MENLLANGSREEAVYLLTHLVSMAEFPGYMINVLDEGALINHSEKFNVTRRCGAGKAGWSGFSSALDISKALTDRHFDLVAACGLAPGDELLMDYHAEPDDPKYYEDACRRYKVSWESL